MFIVSIFMNFAIPLLKLLTEFHPYFKVDYVLADAGYDLAPIYQQAQALGASALIDYNKRNEQPLEGKDKYFRPTCKEGKSYRYDSFDPKYETLKYTSPKVCGSCPFNDGECQKVQYYPPSRKTSKRRLSVILFSLYSMQIKSRPC
ncbi:hypothetical protein A8709_32830 [Paenibacillus pectinilyticus]|uniref:Transposase IS4-like domain-containing protein n=1 Tax=Paenibacillus pectinilyticus TaxID=512399 RepID=A0A1C0ZWY1_9BACL|nr:hypothetical protein A8709_32830 [Paenibacillus pectinilyticus]